MKPSQEALIERGPLPADHGARRAPKISVLIPVYNAADFVAEAISSVLDQSFSDFEIVAIDDGSTDNSGSILRSFDDPRIRIFEQANRGIARTRNRLLTAARGEYVAVFDADDVMLPFRLSAQAAYLDEHPNVVIVGGQCIDIGADGCVLSAVSRFPTDAETIAWQIAWLPRPILLHGTCMFRRDAALQSGGYRIEFDCVNEDEDLISRLLLCGRGANLSLPLIRRRIHPTSASSSFASVALRNYLLIRKLYRKARKDPSYTVSARAIQRIATRNRRVRECGRDATLARRQATYVSRLGVAAIRDGRWREGRHLLWQSIRKWPWQPVSVARLVQSIIRWPTFRGAEMAAPTPQESGLP